MWRKLSDHQQAMADQQMRDWFAADDNRFSRFSLQVGDLFLDYSRHRVTDQTMQLLFDLAQESQLSQRIRALFSGEPVNTSEQRPALHMALRGQLDTPIGSEIVRERARLYEFVEYIRSSSFRHIVNVGIGGSYLGPMMTTHALKDFATSGLHFHFISCVDKAHLDDVLAQIDPETTLFIISSKSFTTLETLLNAKTLMTWMQNKLGKKDVSDHFVAVTAAADKALALGIASERIFPVWEWVGGRYSVWSAIGLPLMLMIGTQAFDEFLAGARLMDEHFRLADADKNMPVLLALLGIWNTNFLGAKAHVIAPYSQRLRYLISYLQQADMESNGKRVSHQETLVTCQTSPVIFGEAGCNAQHSYHQLLHQGTQLIPVDFIVVKQSEPTLQDDVLFASAVSQAQALMLGQSHVEMHKALPGNRPSNILLLDQLSPFSLGALLALYEHKIFAQGVIWNVNSFDQWGVELGKQLLPSILSQLEDNQSDNPALAGLIKQYRKI